MNLSISSVMAAMTYFSFTSVFVHRLNHNRDKRVLYSRFHSLLVFPCIADGFSRVPDNHRRSLRLRRRRCLVVRRLVAYMGVENHQIECRMKDQSMLVALVGNDGVSLGCFCAPTISPLLLVVSSSCIGSEVLAASIYARSS